MKKVVPYIAALFITLSLINIATAYSDIPLQGELIRPGRNVKPDTFTHPPTITIASDNTTFNSSNILLPIQVRVGESTTSEFTYLTLISYRFDWENNNTEIYRYLPPNYNNTPSTEYHALLNPTNISEGKHLLTVNAWEKGGYVTHQNGNYYGDTFMMNNSATFSFTIDTIAPTFEISIENATYSTTDLPLIITTNETDMRIFYNLDYDKANLTLSENRTLSDLASGNHRLEIYAFDSAGNTNFETVSFNITDGEPLPMLPVLLVVLISSIALIFLLRQKYKKL
jgi:hypothetical protein